MNKYEVLYIIDNDIDDTEKTALIDRFSEHWSKNSAERLTVSTNGAHANTPTLSMTKTKATMF